MLKSGSKSFAVLIKKAMAKIPVTLNTKKSIDEYYKTAMKEIMTKMKSEEKAKRANAVVKGVKGKTVNMSKKLGGNPEQMKLIKAIMYEIKTLKKKIQDNPDPDNPDSYDNYKIIIQNIGALIKELTNESSFLDMFNKDTITIPRRLTLQSIVSKLDTWIRYILKIKKDDIYVLYLEYYNSESYNTYENYRTNIEKKGLIEDVIYKFKLFKLKFDNGGITRVNMVEYTSSIQTIKGLINNLYGESDRKENSMDLFITETDIKNPEKYTHIKGVFHRWINSWIDLDEDKYTSYRKYYDSDSIDSYQIYSKSV